MMSKRSIAKNQTKGIKIVTVYHHTEIFVKLQKSRMSLELGNYKEQEQSLHQFQNRQISGLSKKSDEFRYAVFRVN